MLVAEIVSKKALSWMTLLSLLGKVSDKVIKNRNEEKRYKNHVNKRHDSVVHVSRGVCKSDYFAKDVERSVGIVHGHCCLLHRRMDGLA